MNMATRRIMMNMTNSMKHAAVYGPRATTIGAVNTDSFLRFYASSGEEAKQKLLRYPVLPLKETLDKFIRTAEPLLTPEELEETKEEMDNFYREDGERLQELLENAGAEEDNWLSRRWLEFAYMKYRDPVTVYTSPGMCFPMEVFRGDDDYLKHAAHITFSLIKYKEMVDNKEIPVVKMGKFELDNSQFGMVFGTCRIPGPHMDSLSFNPESKHVVVIYKNHFWKLPVYNRCGMPLHPDQLVKEMKKILETEKKKGIEYGLLTTDKRDNWNAAYEQLTNNAENLCAVRTIQESLFTVSLDEYVPMTSGSEWNTVSEQLIHGGGTKFNSANRWMDKTIQVVVNRNGLSGFTYEHSPAEGQPIAVMVDYVVSKSNDKEHFESGVREDYDKVEKLQFKMNECLENHLMTAKRAINRLVVDLDMDVLFYRKYGKNFLKEQKLSPDSFIQMALQYTFYRIHNKPAAQYESAHLRIYTGGRTETIRSCSNESVEFAEAMIDSSTSVEKRADLLRAAVKAHRKYTMWALQGQGVDRHLLGLKLMAMENGLCVPKFFQTPGVKKSSYFRVSTSQVASPNAVFMSYGPSVIDGYSCCYNPRSCDIILAQGAWRSDPGTSAKKFSKMLSKSLDEMHDILVKTKSQESKESKQKTKAKL